MQAGTYISMTSSTYTGLLQNNAEDSFRHPHFIPYCEYLGKESFVTLDRVVWSYICSNDEIFRIHWQLNISPIWST